MKKYITVLLFSVSVCSSAQSSAVGTLTPEASAIFEVKSVKGGFLAPRMTQAQRDAIIAPAAGLMVYNTDVNCYEFWNSSEWFNMCVDGRLDPSSNGTAKVDAYDCSGAGGGTLNMGMASTATQEITVSVTRKGSYNISTGAVNGVIFSDSGTFDSAGTKVITLTGYGSPASAGTYTYALNTAPSCSFDRTAVNGSLLVISSQPAAPPAACSGTGEVVLSVAVSGTTGIAYA
ncbi:hypothetical protein [Flavobacterium humidisoli]|uniref:SprB repeat-containing protein n=1 Tax=Flavobacterium humidisoli TaxID=2937442 RepID=A0ABY4LZB4_9FLAO|nr:hypothetical protein [Flavobacterium humidisoli]UPZ17883.1 hypothetical protein M0M44_11155 [Flavobacterium humidisoli]